MINKVITSRYLSGKEGLKQTEFFLALLGLLTFAWPTSGQQKTAHQETAALQFAARDNNCESIRRLIAGGVDVNSRTPQGVTPLMWASSSGSIDAVRCLLAAGAAVNARTHEGKTALSLTIEYFNHNHSVTNENDFVLVVRQLITSGADIRNREKGGFTPLLWAAAAGNREFAGQLIDAGADVNLKSMVRIELHHYLRVTPLIFSIINATDERTSRLAVVRLLIDKGADVNATDSRGRTALEWARRMNDSDIVRILTGN